MEKMVCTYFRLNILLMSHTILPVTRSLFMTFILNSTVEAFFNILFKQTSALFVRLVNTLKSKWI